MKGVEKLQGKSVVEVGSNHTLKKIPMGYEQNNLESTKQTLPNHRKEDPYSLRSSKMTNKLGEQ